jgi:hypothetical protein
MLTRRNAFSVSPDEIAFDPSEQGRLCLWRAQSHRRRLQYRRDHAAVGQCKARGGPGRRGSWQRALMGCWLPGPFRGRRPIPSPRAESAVVAGLLVEFVRRQAAARASARSGTWCCSAKRAALTAHHGGSDGGAPLVTADLRLYLRSNTASMQAIWMTRAHSASPSRLCALDECQAGVPAISEMPLLGSRAAAISS